MISHVLCKYIVRKYYVCNAIYQVKEQLPLKPQDSTHNYMDILQPF